MTSPDLKKTVILLGPTGAGKSNLGNIVLGSELFTVSADPNSETKETIGKLGKFRDTSVFIIDTPGLNDSDGFDSVHVAKMVDYIKLQTQIDAVVVVLNYQSPRISNSLIRMLKLYCYIFKKSDFAKNVCFLFTFSIRVNDLAMAKRKEDYHNKLQEIMTEIGLHVSDPIPSFFVDNSPDRLNSPDNTKQYDAISTWLSSRNPLNCSLVEHADPQFEKIEEEEREIEVQTVVNQKTEDKQVAYTVQIPKRKWDGEIGKWFGKKKTVYVPETRYRTETVAAGTETTHHFDKQTRLKKTTYSKNIVYTDWATVSTRTTVTTP